MSVPHGADITHYEPPLQVEFLDDSGIGGLWRKQVVVHSVHDDRDLGRWNSPVSFQVLLEGMGYHDHVSRPAVEQACHPTQGAHQHGSSAANAHGLQRFWPKIP